MTAERERWQSGSQNWAKFVGPAKSGARSISAQLVALEDALRSLAALDARNCVFLGGLSVDETVIGDLNDAFHRQACCCLSQEDQKASAMNRRRIHLVPARAYRRSTCPCVAFTTPAATAIQRQRGQQNIRLLRPPDQQHHA